MKALVRINGIEKEVLVDSITVNGELVSEFNKDVSTCVTFKKATAKGFTLAWAMWSATYQKWSCCCKGKGLNNNGNAEILRLI